MAPEEAPGALARAHQGPAQERWPRQVEAAAAVGAHQRCEAALPLGLGERAPVLLDDLDRDPPVDRLEGPREVVAVEGGAEDRRAGDDPPPGLAEGREVQVPLEGSVELLDVRSRARRIQAVKEEPLLQRGERIDVLDICRQTGEVVRGDGRGQRQRQNPGAGAGGELSEAGEETLGEPAHGLLREAVRAVGPGHLEAPGGDEGDDGERVAGRGARALGRAHRLAGGGERRVGGEHRVELPQVVEADRGGWPVAEGGRRRVLGEVAQEPVAEAAPRHGRELAADGGEGRLRARVVAGHEAHGVEAGEPADAPREVEIPAAVPSDLLAAVPLEVDADGAASVARTGEPASVAASAETRASAIEAP